MKVILLFKSPKGWLLLLGLMLFLGNGCAAKPDVAAPAATPPSSLVSDRIIVIGDNDAYEPLKKVKRFRPLADYLADSFHVFRLDAYTVVVNRKQPPLFVSFSRHMSPVGPRHGT